MRLVAEGKEGCRCWASRSPIVSATWPVALGRAVDGGIPSNSMKLRFRVEGPDAIDRFEELQPIYPLPGDSDGQEPEARSVSPLLERPRGPAWPGDPDQIRRDLMMAHHRGRRLRHDQRAHVRGDNVPWHAISRSDLNLGIITARRLPHPGLTRFDHPPRRRAAAARTNVVLCQQSFVRHDDQGNLPSYDGLITTGGDSLAGRPGHFCGTTLAKQAGGPISSSPYERGRPSRSRNKPKRVGA